MESGRRRRIKQEKTSSAPIECPICKRRLLVLYQDPLFKEILMNSGFYKKVKILNNGEYTFENINRPSQGLEPI